MRNRPPAIVANSMSRLSKHGKNADRCEIDLAQQNRTQSKKVLYNPPKKRKWTRAGILQMLEQLAAPRQPKHRKHAKPPPHSETVRNEIKAKNEAKGQSRSPRGRATGGTLHEAAKGPETLLSHHLSILAMYIDDDGTTDDLALFDPLQINQLMDGLQPLIIPPDSDRKRFTAVAWRELRPS